MMRGAILAGILLAGCASAREQAACPAGQEHLRTAQLFLGRTAPPAVNEADLRRFVDEEITPRFPDGVTVLDGGGQWRGSENLLIREAAKVVQIVMPRHGDGTAKIQAVREAYKTRFQRDSALLVTQSACVEL